MSAYLGSTPVNLVAAHCGEHKVLALYVGTSKLLDTVSAKLQADFTTGAYTADGVTKTFDELFTFNRAGKAWLVKDTGLQEYAADVPRFDNGLLIEQSATNMLADSSTIRLLANRTDNPVTQTAINNGYRITPAENAMYISTYSNVKSPFDSAMATQSAYIRVLVQDVIITNPEAINSPQQKNTTVRSTATVNAKDRLKSVHTDNPNSIVEITCNQLEVGIVTSFIATTTAPVTRPADFLFNKITGTTVTGDWDSTLNLSIVNGQLVHSGYGRIRSLEIN